MFFLGKKTGVEKVEGFMDDNVVRARMTLIEDFDYFRSEPSLSSRISLVKRITRQFADGTFSESEFRIAQEIIDALSYDVEKNIRKIIAFELRECKELPHDVAVRLANDVEEVSVPILQFSSVLSDEDLIEIIRSSSEAFKEMAIAKRSRISLVVSDSLTKTNNEEVVSTLIANKGADISKNTTEYIIEEFKNDDNILASLVERGGLDVSVAEKMISIVSSELQSSLLREYNIKPGTIISVTNKSRESATLGLVEKNMDSSKTIDMVNHLYNSGKLNHSIVLRALCKADIEFFECGLAKMANIPFSNARKLVKARDSKGYTALFDAASMPSSMLEATENLLGIILDNPIGENEEQTHYSKRIVGEIVRKHYDRDVPNMRYLVALIGNNIHNVAAKQ